MFLGHAAAALGLQRLAPKVSLGTVLLAAFALDLLFGATLLLGWEQAAIVPGAMAASPFVFEHYPLTHSLVGALFWALAIGALYYARPTRDTSTHFQGSAVVAGAVASHWVLDAVVHAPDLPLAGEGSLKVGLGLWRSLPATVAVEGFLLIAGLMIFSRVRRSRRHRVVPIRLWVLGTVLAALYLAALFGPPPSSLRMVAWTLLLGIPALSLLGSWAGRESA